MWARCRRRPVDGSGLGAQALFTRDPKVEGDLDFAAERAVGPRPAVPICCESRRLIGAEWNFDLHIRWWCGVILLCDESDFIKNGSNRQIKWAVFFPVDLGSSVNDGVGGTSVSHRVDSDLIVAQPVRGPTSMSVHGGGRPTVSIHLVVSLVSKPSTKIGWTSKYVRLSTANRAKASRGPSNSM